MKEINVETYGVPAEGRSKNYRGKTVTASVSGKSASAASRKGAPAPQIQLTPQTWHSIFHRTAPIGKRYCARTKRTAPHTRLIFKGAEDCICADLVRACVLFYGAASDDNIFTSKAVQAKIEDAIKRFRTYTFQNRR